MTDTMVHICHLPACACMPGNQTIRLSLPAPDVMQSERAGALGVLLPASLYQAPSQSSGGSSGPSTSVIAGGLLWCYPLLLPKSRCVVRRSVRLYACLAVTGQRLVLVGRPQRGR